LRLAALMDAYQEIGADGGFAEEPGCSNPRRGLDALRLISTSSRSQRRGSRRCSSCVCLHHPDRLQARCGAPGGRSGPDAPSTWRFQSARDARWHRGDRRSLAERGLSSPRAGVDLPIRRNRDANPCRAGRALLRRRHLAAGNLALGGGDPRQLPGEAWRSASRCSAAGAERLLFERVLEQRSQLRHVEAAIPGAQITVTPMRAPTATLFGPPRRTR